MRWRIATLMAVLAATIIGALALPGAASAATTCKSYDSLRGHGAGQMCLYPAADYPGFHGKVYAAGSPCGAPALPRDIDDEPVFTCAAMSSVPSWKWTGAWQRSNIAGGVHRVYPYAGNWRWIFSDGAWHAVASNELTIRWFCSSRSNVYPRCYAV